ncbi:MAG TPA: DMT family transporter [Aestuariivirgaceae bacterium]|jgi:drug/metabolite transporter (DMT)-like permease|nr:DMT family transporter [Aestuariivirgaceae bacterium]
MTDDQRVDSRLQLSEVNVARGAALIVLAVAGFSLSGAFVRHVPGLTGWQINCWRGLAMAAVLVLYLILAYGLREAWARFRAVPIPAMIACAGFFSVGSTLYVTALTLTSTANVSAIGATSPLFTALLSPYITGERPSLLTWAAALAALFGVGVIVHGGLVAGNVTGNLVSLLVALSFAGQTLSLRRFRNVELMPAMAVGGIVVFLVAAAFADGFAVAPRDMAILALMGPVQLGIPILLLARGARSVRAVTVSIIAMLDIVLNPFWAWTLAGEVPDGNAVVGALIICGAVALSLIAENARRRR